MSEINFQQITEIKNPVIIVNGLSIEHALLADFREEQLRDINFFENITPYLNIVGKDVKLGYYKNSAGSYQPYTHSPLELNQIHALCPIFSIDNYHTTFSDLIALFHAPNSLERALYQVSRPVPFVREDLTWCNTDDLKLEISIGTEGHSLFQYSAMGLKFLEVDSHVDAFRRKLDVFRSFIVSDDTGLYQEATQEVLDERNREVLAVAGNVTEYIFENRFRQYFCRRPYEKELAAAKNVARRMNPSGVVNEEQFEQVYDSAWNTILQQKLSDIIYEMQRDLSVAIHDNQARQPPFADTHSQALEIIIDRLSRGVVNLDDDLRRILGQVIVLDNLYEQAQNQGRVDRIRGEIEKNQYEIEQLAENSRRLLEEMNETQVDVNDKSRKIEDAMRKRLGSMFEKSYEINSLIRDTRPLEVKKEPVVEIPF